MLTTLKKIVVVALLHATVLVSAQETRLLRQPTISKTHVAFTYGSDIWATNLSTNKTVRITSTPAVESDPYFSPDGKWIAFKKQCI